MNISNSNTANMGALYPGHADPRHRRLVTWNVTSLVGKEPELVREVEQYQLDMVGLTSMHSTGSGTKLLERGWTLSFSRVAQGVSARRVWGYSQVSG